MKGDSNASNELVLANEQHYFDHSEYERAEHEAQNALSKKENMWILAFSNGSEVDITLLFYQVEFMLIWAHTNLTKIQIVNTTPVYYPARFVLYTAFPYISEKNSPLAVLLFNIPRYITKDKNSKKADGRTVRVTTIYATAIPREESSLFSMLENFSKYFLRAAYFPVPF